MKVRKKSLCRTCRKRKIRCDGGQPACSQCLKSGRSCSYPDALFVQGHLIPGSQQAKPEPALERVPDHVAPQASPSSLTSLSSRETNISGAIPIYPCLTDPWEKTIALIIRNYVPYREVSADITDIVPQSPRICGSWVTALPELAAGSSGKLGECLTSAMNALAFSITSYMTGEQLTRPISLSYGHALQLLQDNLRYTGGSYKAEQAAAVMCIALLEVSTPTSPNSWLVHIHGLGELIRLSSPDSFSTGIQHTFFIGIRPLLIIEAFVSRKATFLAEEEWATEPFQHHQPSPLQGLFTIAASIPPILEKIDALKEEPTEAASNAAKKHLTQLMKIKMRFESWASSFQTESPRPLYWQKTEVPADGGHDGFLSFPSLSTANAFTHLWSFQIICMLHIRDLLLRFPELSGFKIILSIDEIRTSCHELSVKILQSMEFLMRQEFMLYGRFSAGFPLSIAYKSLSFDAEGRNVLREYEQTVLRHISQKYT
ncbi:c6 zinc finger domain protein [Fusarium flagelliforme]|uniref:C6 zinc finger domain protein n=1 Tax=Fusarium flagelliforme TaxID=2675880 RepID=A0A395N432_9HYPO|nr:c6 zinc finger domain protein [Fusarium flagelliforme]